MKIRKATIKDLDSIIRSLKKNEERGRRLSRKWVEKYFRKDKLILLAFEKNKIIGYSFVDKKEEDEKINRFLDTDKFAAVSIIATDKDNFHKGIGSKLLKESEKYAKKWKKKGVWLDCLKDVIPFYTKNKYKVLGHFMKIKNNKRRRQYVLLKKLK